MRLPLGASPYWFAPILTPLSNRFPHKMWFGGRRSLYDRSFVLCFRGFHMRRLTAATPILAAAALLCAPASAHHSQSMFDTTKEIVIEGTVSRFDWVNPHMYLVIATKG